MIELKNINKTYQMGEIAVHALNNASLKISAGEFIAIMGPSGSGKSTLLHILGFLDCPDSGTYLLGKDDVSRLSDDELADIRNRTAGFVFQQFHLLARMSAAENVALPLIYGNGRNRKEKAESRLKEVGLSDRANHKPNELSGGQQQRVAIARSLVNEPLIIFADEPTGNLDTASKDEIITILKNLNKQGKTIVMVTHESEIAESAERIIRMRDGFIVSDEIKEKGTNDGTAQKNEDILDNHNHRSLFGISEVVNNMLSSVHAIFANKMRSFLSILGIVIGVASVIAMLALGTGAKESISKTMSSMGTNILTIRPGARRMGGVFMQAGQVSRFTLEDVKAISKLPHIKGASGSVSGRGQIVFGNNNTNTQIQGVNIDYEEMRASKPVLGKFFTDEDITNRAKVALLGQTVVKSVFANTNPVGKIIRINKINFKVIGVLPEKGSMPGPGGDRDDMVVIPITTAMYRLLGKQYVDLIDAEVENTDSIDEAKILVSKLIVKRHHIKGDPSNSFNIFNMAEMQQAMTSMTNTMTMLLGFIAMISLFVGGIGIMNIMLVSVTERTSEIGLRKAIGARKIDIMLQFLVESIIMTLGGGIIGIILGTCASYLLSYFAEWATKVSFYSVAISASFSVAVGLGFGLWPARKASLLNPIEALRYE